MNQFIETKKPKLTPKQNSTDVIEECVDVEDGKTFESDKCKY